MRRFRGQRGVGAPPARSRAATGTSSERAAQLSNGGTGGPLVRPGRRFDIVRHDWLAARAKPYTACHCWWPPSTPQYGRNNGLTTTCSATSAAAVVADVRGAGHLLQPVYGGRRRGIERPRQNPVVANGVDAPTGRRIRRACRLPPALPPDEALGDFIGRLVYEGRACPAGAVPRFQRRPHPLHHAGEGRCRRS